MVIGLVLAAGESSRMGRDKALLEYRGKTFLEHILATLREADVDRTVVVLGHHAEEIGKAADLNKVEVVVNRDYRLGQTSSLQAGLRALSRPETNAVILCLVDHPAVSPNVVKQLVAAFQETAAPVAIPTYLGKRGHPVLIARTLFDEILRLDPLQAANTVIHKYRDATRVVEVEDAGILLDVDDPESYRKLKS